VKDSFAHPALMPANIRSAGNSKKGSYCYTHTRVLIN